MIWSALGDVLPEAFGIAISPLPIVLVILMLQQLIGGPAGGGRRRAE